MGRHVVVPKCGHDWHRHSRNAPRYSDVVPKTKQSDPLSRHIVVEVHDLVGGAWNLLVIIMPSRVSGPNHEVDVILEILLNPAEGLVDQGKGGIAFRARGTKVSRRPLAVMTRIIVDGGNGLVVLIGVEIWSTLASEIE